MTSCHQGLRMLMTSCHDGVWVDDVMFTVRRGAGCSTDCDVCFPETEFTITWRVKDADSGAAVCCAVMLYENYSCKGTSTCYTWQEWQALIGGYRTVKWTAKLGEVAEREDTCGACDKEAERAKLHKNNCDIMIRHRNHTSMLYHMILILSLHKRMLCNGTILRDQSTSGLLCMFGKRNV